MPPGSEKADAAPANIHRQSLKPASIVLIVVGGAIITAALLADKLGYGSPGSLGSGQVLLLLVGLSVVLAGFLGSRVATLYRATALILLNTLVLLGILELGAIVVFRSGVLADYRGIIKGYPDLPYYAAQDWTSVYWHEATLSEQYQYKPYVIWRHIAFEGETINIDQEGLRLVPGADCSQDAYTVFTFGGSTMLGWGAPDWGTIPAYLQADLEELVDKPVCVLNLAEDGFVSTQSLITLIAQLQSGNVPDMVIFYDGINEILAAYESGEPGVHVTLAKIAAKFERPEHPLLGWLKRSRLYALAERLTRRLGQERLEAPLSSPDPQVTQSELSRLADSVTQVYLNNNKLVAGLAQEYSFKHFFFLQPHFSVSQKPLTEEEQTLKSRIYPTLDSLARTVYANIESAAPDDEHLYSIAHVLDEQDIQIWIDEWGHITPEGNRLVAEEILEAIEHQLPQK